jgi:hypothetical protein
MSNNQTKPSARPIAKADIAEYLSKHDDFALELRCAKALKERHWDFMHGGSYEDPVSKKTRQFDIRAFRRNNHTQISLAVECKALRVSYPLVVSRYPRTKEESYHEILFCHLPEAHRVHVGGIPRTTRTIRLEYQATIYDYSSPVGKATVQVGRKDSGEITSGDAETYEKWSQALASIQDMIMGSTELAEKGSLDGLLHVALPVLVVSDKTLWAVDYSSRTLQPSDPYEIDETTVFVGKEYWQTMPSCNYTISHLHIFTELGFNAFLDELSGLGRRWSPWFPVNEIEKKFQNEPKQ